VKAYPIDALLVGRPLGFFHLAVDGEVDRAWFDLPAATEEICAKPAHEILVGCQSGGPITYGFAGLKE